MSAHDSDTDLLARLEEQLGFSFQDPLRLTLALTHRSFANEAGGDCEHNERLEFLGDAVLSLVTAQLLMHRHPGWSEGQLSKARSALVSEVGLAELAKRISLGASLRLGRGEEQTGGREKPSIQSDAFEAVLGAVYLDGGFDAAYGVVERLLADAIDDPLRALQRKDPKTDLQERIQALYKRAPSYELVDTSGPEHALKFTVVIRLKGRDLGQGTGRTKKDAEQQAAAGLLEKLAAGERLEDLIETASD